MEEAAIFEGIVLAISALFVIIGKNFLSHKERHSIAVKAEKLWFWLKRQKSGSFIIKLKNYKIQKWIAIITQLIFCVFPFIAMLLLYSTEDNQPIVMYGGAFFGTITFAWFLIPKVIKWVIKPEKISNIVLRSFLVSGSTVLFSFIMGVFLVFLFLVEDETIYDFYSNLFYIVFGALSSIGNPFIIQTLFVIAWLIFVWLMVAVLKTIQVIIFRMSFVEKGYVAAFGIFIALIGTSINLVRICYPYVIKFFPSF